jgi:two-component system, OmpR family, heavy metal sensor histidine kinase CusS
MIERQPIRVRLMLWYSVVLAFSLVVFAGIIWVGLRQSLVTSRASALDGRMSALQAYLTRQDEPALGFDEAKEELGEFATALSADFALRLLDASGSVLYSSATSLSGRHLQQTLPVSAACKGCQIEMSISLAPVDEILGRLNRILAISIPLALLVASVGGYWMTRRALAPVRAMAEAARSVNSSDLSVRLPIPLPKDELRLLAEMWNGMLARLEDGVNRIRQFTADASHDLRTPLSAIYTSAEVTLRKRRNPEEYEETLKRILGQTERATALVEDLLTLARADSMNVDLILKPVELCSLLADTCKSLLPLAHAKALELRLKLPPDPVWVRADAAALQRLVAILVDNAMKNTDVGQIEVRLIDAVPFLSLEVEDTGSGITPEDLPHVFDRFYRGDKSRSSLKGGAGLGLAIAMWIVQSHSGDIQVESNLGRTRFTIQLPRIAGHYPAPELV